jgi:hypothetical protein
MLSIEMHSVKQKAPKVSNYNFVLDVIDYTNEEEKIKYENKIYEIQNQEKVNVHFLFRLVRYVHIKYTLNDSMIALPIDNIMHQLMAGRAGCVGM